jgi:glycerophosphoryl diester phosphodiesterase
MLIIAHRGAPAEAVENTRTGFVAALRSGAHMVETDLQLTLDGHLVIHHDASTRRLFGVNRIIAREPLERLRGLRYPNGDAILTLAELLALIDNQVPVNLELKARGSGATLVRFLATQPYAGQLLISSPHPEELHWVRAAGLEVPLGPVVETMTEDRWPMLAEGWCRFISVSRRRLHAELIQRLHDLGLQVLVYTVNRPRDMEQMATAGADGIFTDNPTLAMRVLRKE